MLSALINGVASAAATHEIGVDERGLSYGDGVFETMRLQAGNVLFIDSHITRLRGGCERLGFQPPSDATLRSDIVKLAREQRDGVVKLIVTRGAGGRGYRPASTLLPTRIAILYPPVGDTANTGIAVRWCATRLARNPRLAGIKHLNRLEQVLAQNEWDDVNIAEGLMMDTEGELVCATSSNLFIVGDGVLTTPDLRFCGVRGVMRGQVIKLALATGFSVRERALQAEDLLSASEAFVTNAVRGIRSIVSLDEHRWPIGTITAHLHAALGNSAMEGSLRCAQE
jgi:4-amino-4-deoxychorismate lyase